MSPSPPPEASARLAAIVESSDDAILSKDLNGVIQTWNAGAQRIFGYTAGEVIGRSITILIPPERLAEETEILTRIRRGERVEHFETVRRHKNGDAIQVSLTISPVFNARGELVGASKIARDITQRKTTEEMLRRRTHALEVLNRVANKLATEFSLSAIVDLVTGAGRELSGAEAGAFFTHETASADRGLRLLSRGNGASGAPFPQPQELASFTPALRGQAAVVIADAQAGPPDGAHPHVAARSYLAVPVVSRGGGVLGSLFFAHSQPHAFNHDTVQTISSLAAQAAIAFDNARLYESLQQELKARRAAESDLRQAQELLRAHAEELEQRVAERTRSLQEAAAQMEEFSYSVSHDLRAPLRAMSVYTQMLLDEYGDRLDDTGLDYVRRIQRSSRRMDDLTNAVLAYSRVASTHLPLATVQLKPVIDDIRAQHIALQSPQAEVRVMEPLAPVRAHEAALGQVLSNLLINATKFVAPGVRPQITISTAARDQRVRVWVVDNGIGIRPEYQARLFRLFERLHGPYEYEGTGVGLAIVRRAVERMGGQCGVESDGVHGSRFWIELPRG